MGSNMDTTQAKQVLANFDKHAAEFNFPVLDNAYVEFAATRLTAFRGRADWLIIFEVLGFSTREVQFVNDIYAYGSCIDREGFIGEEFPVSSLSDEPLFDPETNDSLIDWAHWAVELNGRKQSFSPSIEEYGEAGIHITKEPGPGSLREIELLRYLVHAEGENLFLSTERLLERFPRCGTMPLFLQTLKWEHPDVAAEEKPSQNVSIRSLVEALSSGDALLFTGGHANTHWSQWSDTAQEIP